MKSIKSIILILFIFLFASCKEDPKQTNVTDNPNFKLELLFEVDSCKMYRFNDGGTWVYWSRCKGSVQYDTGGKYSHKVQSIND